MARKKWVIENKRLNNKYNPSEIVKVLLNNRGIKTKKEIEDFLSPKLSDLTIEKTEIDRKEINRSVSRIKKAIDKKEQIIIFGDYDVDGICGSAILWETLDSLGAKVLPYIPHRTSEGYGLSKIGISNILNKHKDTSLIITVDNGIVANDAVDFANENKIDVIITDHHVVSKEMPKAFSIVHTTKLCGTGVAYMLAQQLTINNSQLTKFEHLSLVAIATVADLVPLRGPNRIFLKFGLEELKITKRIGLRALIKEASIDQASIDVYEIGHILGPRINAMGRIELAMDSLRLICTRDKNRAEKLAEKLGSTNKKRQDITFSSLEHAKKLVGNQKLSKLIFISHESYMPGVIGLIAGRLVEEFYRPAIVLSIGKTHSKASARSISGFNIIEFIRSASDLLVDAGGHPMAAGFTVQTEKIEELSKKLQDLSEKLITEDLLERLLKIDVEIFLDEIDLKFFDELSQLSPFGIGNPTPVFITKNLLVSDMKFVGPENQHVSLRLVSPENKPMNAIGFNLSEVAGDIRMGDRIDIVYTIDREVWKGNAKLKLKLKDFRKFH